MDSDTQTAPVSKVMLWAGRTMSAITSLFLLLDGLMKLLKPAPVVEATARMGYPENLILGLGILLLTCLAAYLIPRTSILGAVLLTGYLGGAVSAHVRVRDDMFPVLFPVIVGVLLWGGLFLRDARVRALLSPRS